MSIPPLVCSTPPPPDQCEDDKDPEDFDIPYNLSQDDDEDDGYNYGNFSSYNHYSSNSNDKKDNVCDIETLDIAKVKGTIETEHVEESTFTPVIPEGEERIENIIENRHNHIGTNYINENDIKCEEDINIEDLNLEISEEPEQSDVKEESNLNSYTNESPVNVTNTEDVSELSENCETPSPCDVNIRENSSPENKKDNTDYTDQIDITKEELTDLGLKSDTISQDDNQDICMSTENEANTNLNQNETDIFDFEDFQFVSSETKAAAVVDNFENPWETNDSGNDFGNFTANFDAIESNETLDEKSINPQENEDITVSHSGDDDDDDDFGEFDDFKSSARTSDAKEVPEDLIMSHQIPVLNFQTSDNEAQVMDSITNMLSSVFENEIEESETEFEGKLETKLCTTWAHLRETDVRQPYMVNWNSSLGQKTLLKALCIDSRNILFGPKWGHSMPKYAANLSVAPLQPQKPATPSNASQSESCTTDKSKQGTWADPFTSDGQESCNNETETVVEAKPNNIDVFEAALPSKPDKIYSSTLNVQPLRQINLPDTHIFTPTDSETPRSKTIHYDNSSPITLPQTMLENNKKPDNNDVDSAREGNNDDDYWEFQNFKSSTIGASSALDTKSEQTFDQTKDTEGLKTNVTYQTQVLEPIKMEPIIPTLNWPDPGEVKETFEDFSDFITNSSWANDKSQSEISTPPMENNTPIDSNVLDKINDKHKNVEEQNPISESTASADFDDEFDTFQSALPPKNPTLKMSCNNLAGNSFINIPNQNTNEPSTTSDTDFDYTFPKLNNIKSEALSVNSTSPKEMKTSSISNISNTPEKAINKSASIPFGKTSTTVLQPIPANTNVTTTQTQKTPGQILQPLSLESYSQINWPNPGIDLQDLSRFNPVETLQSLKSELSVGGPSKVASPAHAARPAAAGAAADDDIWGEFVSSKPKQQLPKKQPVFVDDDEWTDFVSSPSVKPQNGLNTISLNVHTNSSIQKSSVNKFVAKNNQMPLDIPTLNYITPKTSGHNSYNNRHFQNL